MRRKILVIVDAQNDFCKKGGSLYLDGAEEAVKRMVDLIDRNVFDNIVYTLDTHYNDYLDTYEGKMLPVKHCIDGTHGHLLHDDIAKSIRDFKSHIVETRGPENSYKILTRVLKSGFVNVDEMSSTIDSLSDYKSAVEDCIEVYVCGFCTDICVISNALALKGICHESPVMIIGDCCVGTTEDMHNAALSVMKSCMINNVNSNEI